MENTRYFANTKTNTKYIVHACCVHCALIKVREYIHQLFMTRAHTFGVLTKNYPWYITVCYITLQYITLYHRTSKYIWVHYSEFQCSTICYSYTIIVTAYFYCIIHDVTLQCSTVWYIAIQTCCMYRCNLYTVFTYSDKQLWCVVNSPVIGPVIKQMWNDISHVKYIYLITGLITGKFTCDWSTPHHNTAVCHYM